MTNRSNLSGGVPVRGDVTGLEHKGQCLTELGIHKKKRISSSLSVVVTSFQSRRPDPFLPVFSKQDRGEKKVCKYNVLMEALRESHNRRIWSY